MKKILKYVIGVLVVALILVAIGLKLSKNKSVMEHNTEIANQKMTVFPVSVVNPSNEQLTGNFKVSGEFQPQHELKFVSETSGRVTALKVENGDYVKKGQVIAQLDNEQTRIDLKQAEASLEKAQGDFDKYTRLAENDAVTKQQLEEIRMAKVNAETRVETLKRQLRISTIVSPISGTINSLALEVGSYLAPGTMIAEIVDVSELKMQVNLLDNEVVRVKTGQKITIVPDLYTNQPVEGAISYISPKADGSGKYLVEIEFRNPGKDMLKAGMSAIAQFEFDGEKTATLIPVKCLAGSVKDATVFVVNGDTVTSRKIQVGGVYGDKIEVTGGLQMSDKVVSTGISNLADGSRVQIID